MVRTADENPALLSYVSALGLMGSLITAVALHKPPFWAMAAGTVISGICAVTRLRSRLSARSAIAEVTSYAYRGLSRILNVVVLIILINAMTAVWFSSGTIQGLMYYGLSLVNPRYVALAGLTLSTLLCTLIGSSVGTTATVGVAIVGIARAFGMPAAPVAGAVMSGALFGDRISLLSPIYHLSVDMTGSDPQKASRRIMATGWVGLAAAAAAATVTGLAMDPRQVQAGIAWSAAFLAGLRDTARISALVLLPTALVVTLAVRKVPVRMCMAVGLIAGIILALFYQGDTAAGVLKSILFGYSAKGGNPQVAGLLHTGGLLGVVNMLLLLLFAGMYTGVMERSGMMDDVSRGLVSRLETKRSFLIGAMGVSVFSAALASNQAMSVIIPARAMERKREELDVPREEFAGALSDSGVVAAGLIPWNVMAVMCSGALQVPPLSYAPYTVFAWALPLAMLWRVRNNLTSVNAKEKTREAR